MKQKLVHALDRAAGAKAWVQVKPAGLGEVRADAARRAESRCGGLCAPLSCGPQDTDGKAGKEMNSVEG